MKRYLDGLTAIHDGEDVYRGTYANFGVADKPSYPRAEHPVIRTHPVTGKKALYVNRGFTTRIVGVPRDESDGDPALSLRARGEPAVPVPLPLAGELDRLLGQSLRPAPRDVGLLAAHALRPPRHRPGRPAGLTPTTAPTPTTPHQPPRHRTNRPNRHGRACPGHRRTRPHTKPTEIPRRPTILTQVEPNETTSGGRLAGGARRRATRPQRIRRAGARGHRRHGPRPGPPDRDRPPGRRPAVHQHACLFRVPDRPAAAHRENRRHQQRRLRPHRRRRRESTRHRGHQHPGRADRLHRRLRLHDAAGRGTPSRRIRLDHALRLAPPDRAGRPAGRPRHRQDAGHPRHGPHRPRSGADARPASTCRCCTTPATACHPSWNRAPAISPISARCCRTATSCRCMPRQRTRPTASSTPKRWPCCRAAPCW